MFASAMGNHTAIPTQTRFVGMATTSLLSVLCVLFCAMHTFQLESQGVGTLPASIYRAKQSLGARQPNKSQHIEISRAINLKIILHAVAQCCKHMRSHCLSSVTDCNGKWCGWYTYIGNKDRQHHCCMYLPFADVNLILRQHTYNMYGIFF